jgi:uncharacterized protein (DUF1800 family)
MTQPSWKDDLKVLFLGLEGAGKSETIAAIDCIAKDECKTAETVCGMISKEGVKTDYKCTYVSRIEFIFSSRFF